MEQLEDFDSRVKARTGHNLANIPMGTHADVPGFIVAKNGNLLIVYVGSYLIDFIDGYERPANEFRAVRL